MSELVKVLETIETKILKIDGPGGKRLTIKTGEGTIAPGQVLAMEYETGKLVKYDGGAIAGTGIEIAHTVFMEDEEADATSEDVIGLCARPGTTFNEGEVVGINPAADHKPVAQLFKSGICLEEVR